MIALLPPRLFISNIRRSGTCGSRRLPGMTQRLAALLPIEQGRLAKALYLKRVPRFESLPHRLFSRAERLRHLIGAVTTVNQDSTLYFAN